MTRELQDFFSIPGAFSANPEAVRDPRREDSGFTAFVSRVAAAAYFAGALTIATPTAWDSSDLTTDSASVVSMVDLRPRTYHLDDEEAQRLEELLETSGPSAVLDEFLT